MKTNGIFPFMEAIDSPRVIGPNRNSIGSDNVIFRSLPNKKFQYSPTKFCHSPTKFYRNKKIPIEIIRLVGCVTEGCQKCSILKPFGTAKLLYLKQSFYEKGAKSLEKFFLNLWKSDLHDFLQITGNKCI